MKRGPARDTATSLWAQRAIPTRRAYQKTKGRRSLAKALEGGTGRRPSRKPRMTCEVPPWRRVSMVAAQCHTLHRPSRKTNNPPSECKDEARHGLCSARPVSLFRRLLASLFTHVVAEPHIDKRNAAGAIAAEMRTGPVSRRSSSVRAATGGAFYPSKFGIARDADRRRGPEKDKGPSGSPPGPRVCW